jgi:serine-type D-Ala-D-Ala carboxypeptidase/endopeptidase (penicillin-binding protein 4)
MKIRSILPLLILMIATPTHATPICPADLPTQINNIVNHPKFDRATWGILIQTRSKQTLYTQNATKFLIPASNAKLLTTAAALQALPNDFRVKTSIYKLGNDRYLVRGEGDPSLNDQKLDDLAQQLKRSGVKQIEELILDDRIFGNETINPNWEYEDIQSDYAPPINGLILNENAIGLTLKPTRSGQPLEYQWQHPEDRQLYTIANQTKTVEIDQPEFLTIEQPQPGTVRLTGQLRIGAEPESIGFSIQNPKDYFQLHFTQALKKAGIITTNLKGPLRKGDFRGLGLITKPIVPPIAQAFSPALPEWIQETNRNSNNLYAETLLRQLGTPDKTRKSAIATLQTHLTTLGINPTSYNLTDGSGLARKNTVSPEAFIQVLQALATNPTFRSSLPIAGQPGSLKTRFTETTPPSIVQAKTGYLTGATALSGYVQPPNYDPIVFSILLNHSTETLDTQRNAIDAIVVLLTQLKPC